MKQKMMKIRSCKQDELNQFERNENWELVHRPSN